MNLYMIIRIFEFDAVEFSSSLYYDNEPKNTTEQHGTYTELLTQTTYSMHVEY